MKFSEKIRDELDLILNEATFIDLLWDENADYIICQFELLTENDSNDSNFIQLKLENIKKYISVYKIDVLEKNELIKFPPQEISKYLTNFVFNDLYGWEFFNVENSNMDFSEMSFEYVKSRDFETFNSLELFKEDMNDIIIKIWFENLNFLDLNSIEIDEQLIFQKQNNIWKTIFKK
jgi:hypothetical protein